MVKKKIILTRHAQERMRKRGVSYDDIIKTIDHPTHKYPKEADNTQEFRRKANGKENYVVVEYHKVDVVVITVGWSEDEDK